MIRASLLAMLGTLLVAGPAGAAVREIPSGRTLVVVGQQDAAVMDDHTAAIGREPAGVMWYVDLWKSPADMRPDLARIERHLRAHPNSTLQLGVSFGSISTPQLTRAPLVPAGLLDGQITTLANWLKRLDTQVFLRIGYEFDLLGGQYGPPAVYVPAYRHVVDRLRGAGVSNVAYVWHSAGAVWRLTDASKTLGELQPIKAFYPGRRYVDYFAISYWGDSCCAGRSGPQARREYERRTRVLLGEAREMGLPLMLGEATPAYVGADSGRASVEWLAAMFGLVEEFDIRALATIVPDWRAGGFFAAPFWNGYWPDARIHKFADTRARYLAETARPRYVHGCRDLVAWLRAEASEPCPRATAVRPRVSLVLRRRGARWALTGVIASGHGGAALDSARVTFPRGLTRAGRRSLLVRARRGGGRRIALRAAGLRARRGLARRLRTATGRRGSVRMRVRVRDAGGHVITRVVRVPVRRR